MSPPALGLAAVSDAFVTARREARSLAQYPGVLPTTLADAYAIQDASIDTWGDEVAGWKIGLIPAAYRAAFNEERLAGPIFRRRVEDYRAGRPGRAAFIAGGFGAIEAEFVLKTGDDLPPEAAVWADRHLARFIEAMHVGVELAGSPLKAINELGPISIISDFGNNSGLVVGPAIPGWEERPLETLRVQTTIDRKPAGDGSAVKVPGGPLAALRFLIKNLSARGRALKAGTFVSTGAVTGIHEVTAGAQAVVDFFEFGTIELVVETAEKRR